MSTVILAKKGLFVEEQCGGDKIRKRVKKKEVWSHLREACDIEEGVTLLDIFHTVEKYIYLQAFLSQYSWCNNLSDFHAQAEEPNYNEAEEDPNEKLEYLEIYWGGEHSIHRKKEYVDITYGFHGLGYPTEEGNHWKNGRVAYGIEFMPMYSLAHLPVKLDKEVMIYESYQKGKSQLKVLVQGQKEFSLLEALDAIYDEISFFGTPGKKAEKLQELKELKDSILDGSIETVPWDLEREIQEEEDND